MDLYGNRANLLSTYQDIIETINKSKKAKISGSS